jgi:hypothetical protein
MQSLALVQVVVQALNPPPIATQMPPLPQSESCMQGEPVEILSHQYEWYA